MRRRAAATLTTLLVTVVVAAACSGSGPEAGPPSSGTSPTASATTSPSPAGRPGHVSSPRPFAPATADLPKGFARARCSDLRATGNSGLAVSLAVPPAYHPVSRDDTSCGFAAGFGREFYVSFGGGPSLLAEKERDVDPFVDVGGDDSLSDVRYAAGSPVFGAHDGELLAYYCFCDGQDLDQRVAQARGVRLTWTTPHGHGTHDAAYRAVTDSLALVRSHTSTCTSRGRTVTFRPPLPQTESIDFGGGVCHLYLRPGRASLLRYAEIAARPTRSLDELAARLRARKDVTAVRLEPAAGRLAGQVADRLTWTITRRHETQDYQPAGNWRSVALDAHGLRVTWSATPRQWRTERKDAAAFFRSVR